MSSTAINGAGEPLPHVKTLLNHIVDHVAAKKPQALYAEFPVSALTYEEGFRKVTYGDFANAINGIAWWLHENLGPGGNLETLAFIGPNNLLYPSLILGAVKAGYKILLLSPRNSVPGQLHLLQETNCKIFLTPNPQPAPVVAILAARKDGMRVLETPTMENLLQSKARHYPYNKIFENACDEPLVVMHTSGSTGFPKPIIWTHGFCASYATSLQLEPPSGFESVDKLYEGNRIFVMFPPFHAAYVAHVLVNGISFQSSVILPLQSAIPSAQSLSDALKHTKIDAAFVVPSILEEMSKSPELLDHVTANLDTVVYSGGDLPLGCGNVVASRILLINFYGSTEGASLPLVRLEEDTLREDWKFLHIHPEAGVEFRHYTENMYELFIVRHAHIANHQQIFKTFPDLQEFQTRDLFIQHPTKPNRWSHCGRSDDIVVFLTGEKTYPVPMEQHILSSHREISGTIVAGSQRFQTALLVELANKEDLSPVRKAAMIEQIWRSVEEANKQCPAHARLAKSHIIFTPPGKPMVRTPKGTVMRAASLAQYTKELDSLYANVDNSPETPTTPANIDPCDSDLVLPYLRATISRITGLEFQDGDNFFVNGMDSLQALLIAREVMHTVGIPKLVVGDIYANPSVVSLVKALKKLSTKVNASVLLNEETRAEDFTALSTKYYKLIDHIPFTINRSGGVKKNGSVFLLTGSTGALGSHLLHSLLAASETAHVYCLNRSLDGESLQAQRNKTRGLATKFPKHRVTFLFADLSKSNFGLHDEVYTTLFKEVTKIIHNAWPVNFRIPLSSFEPQLEGLISLVRFASEAPLSPSIMYLSSVSAVSNLDTKSAALSSIPEKIVDTKGAPAAMGYGESKYLSERILDHAAKKLGLQIKIARIGQIAGPIQGPGLWNRAEWFPSLIISSLFVGAVPETLGRDLDRVDWIPVDELAEILLELYQTTEKDENLAGAEVFNLLNLHQVEWKSLLPVVSETLSSIRGDEAKIETVDFESWIESVGEKMNTQSDGSSEEYLETLVNVNPAIKLMDFYREEAAREKESKWDTARAEASSERLRALGGVERTWMQKWIRGWFGKADGGLHC